MAETRFSASISEEPRKPTEELRDRMAGQIVDDRR